MPVFRLGLVGAGRMGLTHLRALERSRKVKVVAIAEAAPDARSRLPLPAGRIFPDCAAMLDAGGLDGVLVAVPTPAHVATVREIAAAGLPILCEKPCGLNVAEARAAAAAADAAGVRLQVAYWRRFVPALRRLRERIAAGALGDIYLVACHQWDETPPSAAFRRSGGGAFLDMGVHEFDQMRWLSGQEPGHYRVARSAATFDAVVPEDPDAVQALCDLSGGATGLVSLGRRFPPGDACWVQVFGTLGFENCRFLWPPRGDAVLMAALRRQAEDFAAAVAGAASEGATGKDAIAALEAAEAAGAALRADPALAASA
ncbi:MAG: Gfo/Idh/MocA family oxidoreductase [Rubellimicrobium sp.]|nr:Gfo/Idh/MocA family oxidoreductase [Rubellimicrobium sp.]